MDVSNIHNNLDNADTSNTYNSLHGGITQFIQNFNKINMKEINPTTQNINESIFEEDLSIIVDELINLNLNYLNKGYDDNTRKHYILDSIINHGIILQEIYNWLLNNQYYSNSICLLGYFNYHGIETSINKQKAYELYQKAAELENIVAQLELSGIYLYEEENDDKAFELIKKIAEKGNPNAIDKLGYCYELGIGIDADVNKAFELYQKSADFGNSNGLYNLGNCYECACGISENNQKAFELYQKSADLGNLYGIGYLAYCYKLGIGTDINNQKALELFQKVANSGDKKAQFNVALMYENGNGTENDIVQAIYWYKKSANQGYKDAEKHLNLLLKNN
ncbi:hypothetical protein RclHR1_09520008 [Rhizophagus clarus]|uniref:Kinase-like domain-containing protein n=1 Tax=Rhizophagus clarus TaxID=94130 RepID=A0A2Z6SAR0_9GLOM|nr:hypothetical protein RclHR1_09520008 [Rhizophagus clarus]GES91068.1 kinase-like domain-containing protein [Rhizophagus clarus]